MREIIVHSFEAFDGEVFLNQEDCENWENQLKSCMSDIIFYDAHGNIIKVDSISDFEDAYNNSIVMVIRDVPNWQDTLDFSQKYFGFPCETMANNFIPGWYFYDSTEGLGNWVRM